jgi:hypothetical protein
MKNTFQAKNRLLQNYCSKPKFLSNFSLTLYLGQMSGRQQQLRSDSSSNPPAARTEYAASTGSASSQPPVVVIGTLEDPPTKPSSTQTPLFQVSTPPGSIRDSSFQQAGPVSISRPKRTLKNGKDTASFKKRQSRPCLRAMSREKGEVLR